VRRRRSASHGTPNMAVGCWLSGRVAPARRRSDRMARLFRGETVLPQLTQVRRAVPRCCARGLRARRAVTGRDSRWRSRPFLADPTTRLFGLGLRIRLSSSRVEHDRAHRRSFDGIRLTRGACALQDSPIACLKPCGPDTILAVPGPHCESPTAGRALAPGAPGLGQVANGSSRFARLVPTL
jgi:hypothetical protein